MKQTFNIEGMACEHCKARVEKAVSALQGVREAEANVAGKSLEVDYDEALLTADAIIDAVEDAGYGCKL